MDVANGVEIGSTVMGTGLTVAKNIAKALPTHRQCIVWITNECSNYTLCSPCVHTESGRCFDPFPPNIQPSVTSSALFSKIANAAGGSVGVFTLDLCHNSTKESTEKLAVMYKVPFDLNLKSNAYAVGVFDIGTACDRNLFREMAKNTNTRFVSGKAKGPSLTYKSDTVTIMATMSDCNQPIMRVTVSEN